MMLRFSYGLLLLISSLALPWWATLLLVLLLSLHYQWYYEGLLAFVSYELIYGVDLSVLWLSLGYLLFVPVLEFIKSRLYVFR